MAYLMLIFGNLTLKRVSVMIIKMLKYEHACTHTHTHTEELVIKLD